MSAVVEHVLTEEQLVIAGMIKDVEQGRWCRDVGDDGHGHHCAVGLAHLHTGHAWELNARVIKLLDAAIPKGTLDGDRGVAGKKVNGGTSRGRVMAQARVCSFNNTAADTREITAWFSQAMQQ